MWAAMKPLPPRNQPIGYVLLPKFLEVVTCEKDFDHFGEKGRENLFRTLFAKPGVIEVDSRRWEFPLPFYAHTP